MKAPLLAAVTILAACAPSSEGGAEAAEPVPAEDARVEDVAKEVFGHFETRHGTVTVFSTPEGPLFTLERDGEVVAEEVDHAWLEEHEPELGVLFGEGTLLDPEGSPMLDVGYSGDESSRGG